MLAVIWNIISLLITFTILVSVHEFGHFLIARYFDVAIKRFSIGFGKQILTFNMFNTKFVISCIPLGGYIKMIDINFDKNISENLKNKIFNSKLVWQKIAIVSSGCISNFLFAIFLQCMVLIRGISVEHPVIFRCRS
ncbi:MAG: hypothetical protein FT671_03015 [Pantoea sp. Brub]|nr:hypothetical protein [Pantoea sp. Brub]